MSIENGFPRAGARDGLRPESEGTPELERRLRETVTELDELYFSLSRLDFPRREPVRGLIAAVGTVLRDEIDRSNDGDLRHLDPTTRDLLSQSLSELGFFETDKQSRPGDPSN